MWTFNIVLLAALYWVTVAQGEFSYLEVCGPAPRA